MNRMRAATGLFAVAESEGLVSPDYATLDPQPGVDPHYYLLLFKAPAMRTEFRRESKGLGTGEAGFLRLYTDRFGILTAPWPPLEEQQAIVIFVTKSQSEIDVTAATVRREIDLLLEYQRRLVSDVVTGKLDVREAALSLPDQSDESEPTDEFAAEEEADVGAAELKEAVA